MKNFLTSVVAVLIAAVGTLVVLGAKPSDILQMASTLVHRIASAVPASAPSATPAVTAAPPAPALAASQPAVAPDTTPPMTLASLKTNPSAWPKTVVLKEGMEFPAMFNGQTVGSVQVGAGTMVTLVSVKDGGMLRVQFQGATKEIPAAATDVLEQQKP
jgi:hypothetical protein